MIVRFGGAVAVAAVVLAGCSASEQIESSAPTSTTTGALPAASTSAVTTTSLPPTLHLDPRITPIAELDAQEVCKIPDVTPDGRWPGRSGFPMSPDAGDPSRNLRVLVVPIAASDSPFTEADRGRVERAVNGANEYFRLQSYGRVGLEVSWTDSIVEFPGTVIESGWIASSPRFDRSFTIDQAIELMGDSDLDNFDVLAFFAPADKRFDFGTAGTSGVQREGLPRLRTLMGGMVISSWSIFAHEILHNWVGSEDLYSFVEPGTHYMGDWDIMANGRGNLELNSWLRWIAGWIVDEQVRCLASPRESTHFIEGLPIVSERPKMVVVKLNDNAVMVIDSRRTVKWGVDSWDTDAPATLVYVVDTSFRHGEGPLRLRGTLEKPADSVESDGVRVTLLESSPDGDLIRVEPSL